MRSSGFFALLIFGLIFAYVEVIKGRSKLQSIRTYCVTGLFAVILILVVLTVIGAFDSALNWNRLNTFHLLSLLFWVVLLNVAWRLSNPDRAALAVSLPRSPRSKTAAILLFVGLVVSQLTWSLGAPAEGRRFWWLWSLECLFIAFALMEACRGVGSRRARPAWLASVLVLSLAIPGVAPHLRNWRHDGWGGHDDPVIRLIDQLASHRQLTAERPPVGSVSVPYVSISYDMLAEPFNLAASSVDPRYSDKCHHVRVSAVSRPPGRYDQGKPTSEGAAMDQKGRGKHGAGTWWPRCVGAGRCAKWRATSM